MSSNFALSKSNIYWSAEHGEPRSARPETNNKPCRSLHLYTSRVLNVQKGYCGAGYRSSQTQVECTEFLCPSFRACRRSSQQVEAPFVSARAPFQRSWDAGSAVNVFAQTFTEAETRLLTSLRGSSLPSSSGRQWFFRGRGQYKTSFAWSASNRQRRCVSQSLNLYSTIRHGAERH